MKHLLILTLVAGIGVSSSTAQPEYESNDVIHVAQWICDWSTVGDMVEQRKEVDGPINQELVDEGVIVWAGMNIHHYGDEWNVSFVTRASSLEQLEVARKMRRNRRNERFPELEFAGDCSRHRDNTYYMADETTSN